MKTDLAAIAERLIESYNAKDFVKMKALVSSSLDFAHFNRAFSFNERDALFEVLANFAANLVPDRKFLPAERVNVCGSVVIREGYWTGTAKVDLPGFAAAGGAIRLKFCSVLRFDSAGILVEWKDYG